MVKGKVGTMDSPGGDETEGLSGSLAKGLRISEILLESPTPLSLSDLAAASGLDSSTTYRLLQTLIERGHAVRDEISKRYLAGPRALSSLSLLHPLNELRRESTLLLNTLRDKTGETAALVVFLGLQRLVVDVARGAHPLVPYYNTWLSSPLHGSATGKVLLASIQPPLRKRLIGEGPLAAATDRTITDQKVLDEALSNGEALGYFVARDDAFVGMTAVGAPLLYGDRTVGCLAITGRSESITQNREETIGQLLKTSAALLTNSAPSLRAVYYMFNSPVVPLHTRPASPAPR